MFVLVFVLRLTDLRCKLSLTVDDRRAATLPKADRVVIHLKVVQRAIRLKGDNKAILPKADSSMAVLHQPRLVLKKYRDTSKRLLERFRRRDCRLSISQTAQCWIRSLNEGLSKFNALQRIGRLIVNLQLTL